MKDDWKEWLVTACRLFCGGVFLYASLDKLGEAERFAQLVQEYHIVPSALVPLSAVVVPWLEFLIGSGLVTGFRWRGAALVYCGLLAVYSVSIGWNLLLGVEMNCGCFSLDSVEKASWLTVGRDLALLLPGLAVLWARRTRASLDDILRLPEF